jgi:hypothetical protein
MNPVMSVIHHWRDDGVPLNPPASDAALARLADALGGPIPQDLHRLYATANGMADNATDEWNVNLWSIERILRENDVVLVSGAMWMAFADVLLDTWCFRLTLNANQAHVFAEETGEVLASLTGFFKRYAERPESLGLTKSL